MVTHSKIKQRLVWLSIVVMLGVWGNSLVLFVCPHMLGGSCSGTSVKEDLAPQNNHCAATNNKSKQSHRSSLSVALSGSSSECSQCIMQGAEGLAPTVVASPQTTGYEKSPPSDASSTPFELSTLVRWSVDVRDHSPPRNSAKIHVLINTYLI